MDRYIILGAGGHGHEVFEVLSRNHPIQQLSFFDNTIKEKKKLFESTVYNLEEHLQLHDYFYLGIGGTKNRRILSSLAVANHLIWKGIRSETAIISKWNISVHYTVDVMDFVTISPNVKVGKGTLLNRGCSIHHDVIIGEFCEISPKTLLLGGVKIGKNVTIGAGAVILPKIVIEDNVIVGAGAVVTRDVEPNEIVVGVPATRFVKQKNKHG